MGKCGSKVSSVEELLFLLSKAIMMDLTRQKRGPWRQQKLSMCLYKHDFTFSFEKFISVLQGFFKTLERYDQPMYKSDMVKSLFERCEKTHPKFKQEVTICGSQHDTFIEAIT